MKPMPMKVNSNGYYNVLYDALKRKEAEGQLSGAQLAEGAAGAPIALDDTERVKVLSPGRLVAKRFFRNKLALVGLVILIFMFLFAFIGAVVYPYSQTQIFYMYDFIEIDYASATERTEYNPFAVPGGPALPAGVTNRFNSYVIELESAELDTMTVKGPDGVDYTINKLGDRIFTLSTAQTSLLGEYLPSAQIASYNSIFDTFEWTGAVMPEGFEKAALAAIERESVQFEFQGAPYSVSETRGKFAITRMNPEFSGAQPGEGFLDALEGNLSGDDFEFDGQVYKAVKDGAVYNVFEAGEHAVSLIGSTFVFNSYELSRNFSDDFRINALLAIYGSGEFSADGAAYSIVESGGDVFIADGSGQYIAELSIFSIRRYSGQDTIPMDFKDAISDVLLKMKADNVNNASFVYGVQEIDEDGYYVFNDDGTAKLEDTTINVTRRPTGEYVLTCLQRVYLIDIYASPTAEHRFGTDGDGMDILARMMYGGRISLMVGFVVVFLEIFIGVLMGGTSGFFGGWVDTLIMRIADVFYCIPTYPILIILGALFDKQKMDAYMRLLWMMITMGVLGWASVARLVRGQILSLREQEFMIAQEATGMKARKRIFRHLVPNVMPQLIVTATMGVGSVIIMESTLSFLGLGVKHPLATWGTMANAVTGSAEAITKYAYIWIPVGLLICLTVVAFNFVGDGLRDAFDPKMRR